MKLVDQWSTVAENLPAGWDDVRLTLTTEQPGELVRAAQVLGPMNAGRVGQSLVFYVRRAGAAQGPDAARRLFARLDEERVWCVLAEPHVRSKERPGVGAGDDLAPVASSWDAALAPLPPDWTDLLCELEVLSSDYLDPTALLCAPLNPTRVPSNLASNRRVIYLR